MKLNLKILILVVLVPFGINTTDLKASNLQKFLFEEEISKRNFIQSFDSIIKFNSVRRFFENEFKFQIKVKISPNVKNGAIVDLLIGQISISPTIIGRDINLLRFTFAHELGHLILQQHIPFHKDRKLHEFKADHFATIFMKKWNFDISSTIKYLESLPGNGSHFYPSPKFRARKIRENYYRGD